MFQTTGVGACVRFWLLLRPLAYLFGRSCTEKVATEVAILTYTDHSLVLTILGAVAALYFCFKIALPCCSCIIWYLHDQIPPIAHGDLKGSSVMIEARTAGPRLFCSVYCEHAAVFCS